MIKPSENVIRAIIGLEGNTFWKEVVAWVNKSLMTQSLSANKLSGEATIKMQGRNLELEELITHISKAREYENTLKETRRIEAKGA